MFIHAPNARQILLIYVSTTNPWGFLISLIPSKPTTYPLNNCIFPYKLGIYVMILFMNWNEDSWWCFMYVVHWTVVVIELSDICWHPALLVLYDRFIMHKFAQFVENYLSMQISIVSWFPESSISYSQAFPVIRNVRTYSQVVYQCWAYLNLSPASVAYMCQWIRSAMIQITALRRIGAKQLSKLMPGYCQLAP